MVLSLIACLLFASVSTSFAASDFQPQFTDFTPLYSSDHLPSIPARTSFFSNDTDILSHTWKINVENKLTYTCHFGGLMEEFELSEESTINYYFRFTYVHLSNPTYFAILTSPDLTEYTAEQEKRTIASKELHETTDEMQKITVRLPAGKYYFTAYSLWTSLNGGRGCGGTIECYATYDPVNKQNEPQQKSVTPTQVPEIKDLPAIAIKKPKASKKTAIVKWKKISKAKKKKIQGIEIQVSTDSSFKNIVKQATASKKKTSKKIKGLKSKKKYWVRIRAYRYDTNGKHVSAWKTKTVKAK